VTTLTLADRFIRDPIRGVIVDRDLDRVVARMRQARKYVLSTEATRVVAELVRDDPGSIARVSTTVRAPHDLMWVEIDNPVFWETMNGRPGDLSTMDTRVGYLIDSDRAYCIASNREPPGACLWPMAYELHTPWSQQSRDYFQQISQLTPEEFLWGSSIYRLKDDERGLLGQNHSAGFLKLHPKLRGHRLTMILPEGTADLRNIVALLSVLSGELLEPVLGSVTASRRTFSGGRTVRLHEYTAVAHLRRRVQEDRATSNQEPPPGPLAGRVVDHRRGHWVHDGEARDYAAIAGCIHEWEAASDFGSIRVDNQRFRCRVCGGKRWWRSEIDRGAGVGSVVRVTV
jgi:hypothetical protein